MEVRPKRSHHPRHNHDLGCCLLGTPVNGFAPNVKIIPFKAFNQNGRGWSSVVAMDITYIANRVNAGMGYPCAYEPVISVGAG